MKSVKKIKAGLILIGLVLGVGVGNASGFEGTLDSLNSQNFPFIFLNTRVIDNGTAITDLTANNFQCSENGTAQTDFFQVTLPQTSGGVRLADIVFLIDTSGSMGGAISEVKNNVNAFADALAVSDVDYRLGLVQFGQSSNSGHPELFNDGNLTDNADQFKGFVSSLSATGGYEPGFLALRMAAQGFNFRPGAQKVFLLVSDEDSDDRDKEGTITLMQTNDVVVHTAVSCSSGYSNSDYCDETSVRAATGGQLFGVQGPYSEILDSIVEQTASAYIVRYKSSNPSFDGTERNVECVITRDTDQTTISGSYIPGSAPSIELSLQTKVLNQTTLPENSTDAIIRASVSDEAAPFVQLNGVRLYYRVSNSGSDYSSTVMNLNGQYYEAAIPVVSPPGIDYYLTATDGEQTSSLPSTDPGIHPFQIAVLPNVAPEMNHEPITTASANQPITIIATITDTTDSLQEALLKYRCVGELIYKTVEMQNTSGDIFEATIPADEVTEDIEYYLIAKDNFNVASFEATVDEPFVIVVEENDIDISITSTPLEFYNDESPYLPNVLKIMVWVTNEGNVRVDGITVELSVDGRLVFMSVIDSLEPGKRKIVPMTWNAASNNVENKTLKVEAILNDQVDSNLSNNVISQPISFHWVDFRYDEDAFSFSNEDWEYNYSDELTTVFENNGIIGKARAVLGGFILSYTQSKDGHCHGMATASTHWYIAPQDKPRQINTFEMNLEQEDVKANIINHHWSQVFYRVKFWKDTLASYNAQGHYNAILQDIKKGFPVAIGLGNSWSLSGHTVTAYGILEVGNEKRVYIYDNESPLKNVSRVGDHNSAIFKMFSNEAEYWGFDRVVHIPKEYSLLPSSLDFSDITKQAIKQLWDSEKMFFWEHSPADPLVTDGEGRKTGYVGDTFYDEIPGAEVKKVDGTYSFYLPLEFTYSIEMIGTDTGNVGVDFVIPVSESQAEVAIYKDMPVTLGSQISATVNPTALTYQITSETGEVITPDDEGKLDADFVTSAKWLKEKAVENLEEAKTGNNKVDKKINRVIKDINKSLQDNLWQDEIYLDSKKGRKVFRYEMDAITKMKLYLYLSEHSNYHKLPENVVLAFEEAIENLIVADEILAQAILNEAKNAPVKNPRYQNRFDRMIAKAEQNLEQANQYSENKPARAIFKYGFSWYYSQKAIKYASKN